ncbi:MAG: ABC transporter substrate-binding protein [Pseudomonadota bacterium]
MKKILVTSSAFLLALFLVLGSAYGADPDEIRIGACESATGMFSGFATGGIFGMKTAVADINKQGGIFVKKYNKKLPVRMILVDNQSDPAKAGTLASDLILRDKVHVLMNSPGPASMFNPQSIVAERNQIPYIAGEGPLEPWQAARRSADPPWQYTWGFGFAIGTPPPAGDFRAGKAGYTVADTWFDLLKMFGEQTNKKMALFATDEADGRGWYANFPKALKSVGYDIYGFDKKLGLVAVGTTNYSALIREWKKNKCEILVGNSTAPDFATMWRQARSMGWVPKIALIGRATLFYEDMAALGGDLPVGLGSERLWCPEYPPELFPGIGGRTPMSLYKAWNEETKKPLNQGIGWGYFPMQVVFNAIARAGTLEGPAINKAMGATDMPTISGRAVFTKEEQHCRLPLTYSQWMKTDKPWKWENPVVFSKHEFMKPTAKPIFPIPK